MPNTEPQEEIITTEEADAILDDAEVDFESEARKEGWVPLEEFRGPKSAWKTAEKFVHDGMHIASIQNAKVKRLQEKLDRLEKQQAEFTPFMRKAIEKAEKEAEKARAELKAARKKAIEEGDGEAFERADEALQNVVEKPYGAPKDEPPEVREWASKHPEYQSNPDGSPANEYTAVVNGLADLAIKTVGQNAPISVYFEELDRRIENHFKPAAKPTAVASGRPSKQTKKSKSYDDLPADAKKACDMFTKNYGLTREEYLKNYDWSEA